MPAWTSDQIRATCVSSLSADSFHSRPCASLPEGTNPAPPKTRKLQEGNPACLDRMQRIKYSGGVMLALKTVDDAVYQSFGSQLEMTCLGSGPFDEPSNLDGQQSPRPVESRWPNSLVGMTKPKQGNFASSTVGRPTRYIPRSNHSCLRSCPTLAATLSLRRCEPILEVAHPRNGCLVVLLDEEIALIQMEWALGQGLHPSESVNADIHIRRS